MQVSQYFINYDVYSNLAYLGFWLSNVVTHLKENNIFPLSTCYNDGALKSPTTHFYDSAFSFVI